MIKIIIDKDIPFIDGVFEPYAKVLYMKGSDIKNSDLKDVDGIIIRTRTKCNESLLGASSVKFIASATIGQDHVDLDYCKANNITFTNAIGCNARGVMQYVFTSLFYVAEKLGLNILPAKRLEPLTIGIVGYGHVGKEVAAFGRFLGFNILINDPFKEKEYLSGRVSKNNNPFVPLDFLLRNSDIVSMHPSLNESSFKMINKKFFELIREGAIFINASRGEVLIDSFLLEYKDKLKAIVLDVWNNEPNISLDVLNVSTLASPHLAGYSLEGKINGTQMVVRQAAEFFGINELKSFLIAEDPCYRKEDYYIDFKNMGQKEIADALLKIFPIFEQDSILRDEPLGFENQRSLYKYRREFNY